MTDARSSPWRSETTWELVLSSFSIEPSGSFHKSVYDPTIRTYLQGGCAHKITLRTDLPDLYPKLSPGASEAALLRRCEGIAGVPAVRGFRETTTACVLSMDRLEGTALQDVLGDLTFSQASRIIVHLLRTTLAISWRGIAHNDIVPRNIMVSRAGRPYLVDFDQAHHTSRTDALLRNVLGIRTQDPLVYGSWLLVAARLVFHFLPQGRSAGMPELAPDASAMQRKLSSAWKIAQRASRKAQGEPVAEYSLLVGDMQLPGRRPWEQRWDLLRSAADFTGLRALDLGCHMGLLCTWLLKEGKASSALGIDSDPLILAAAKQIAAAFSVEAAFEKIDLDAAYPWEERFDPADFDVIFALGVLDLVRDQQRLMNFLARFPLIVFEGHDQDAVEIKRFCEAGFPNHAVVGTTDSGRSVFVFSR